MACLVGFVAKRIPEKLDVIVIGSGIAGLTAATLLSRADKTVLVLEQHDQAGGACHSFIEGGYEFEPGTMQLTVHSTACKNKKSCRLRPHPSSGVSARVERFKKLAQIIIFYIVVLFYSRSSDHKFLNTVIVFQNTVARF